MDPLWARAVVLAANLVMVAIRAPHGERSRKVSVAVRRKGPTETALLTFAWLTFALAILWVFSPLFAFADYPLRPVPLGAGTLLLGAGLALFHRSHADLGTQWSITLELREGHRLVTGGVYSRIRHPMYAAILLLGAGQALALPNWLAGPAYGVAILLIVALRIGPEERMMRERFGEEWDAYAARTGRLVPGIW